MKFINKIIFIILFLVIALGFSTRTNAQIVNIPFGGIVTSTIPCTCSGNFLTIIFDYRTFQIKPLLISPPFSKIYQYWTFVPGSFVLGSYTPGQQCMVTVVGADCEPIPTEGVINQWPGAGTSLPNLLP